MSAADYDAIRRLDGMFVGLLSPEEQEAFENCIQEGTAQRSYEGAGGFMGLAKVRLSGSNHS